MAATACGGDDDDDDGGTAVDAGANPVDAAVPVADAAPDVGPSLDELPQPLAGALCPLLFECCSAGDLGEVFEDEPEQPADAAACVTVLTPLVGEEIGGIAEAVAAGRIAYDPARMAACLEVIPEGQCGGLNAVFAELFAFPGCEPPFTALVEVGDACGSNEECKSGFCIDRVNDELGTCADLPGEGDKCEFDCADGFTCDDISSTCIPQRPDGDTCENDQQCVSDSCLEGLCGQSPVCDGKD
jgi:hypothetical protein